MRFYRLMTFYGKLILLTMRAKKSGVGPWRQECCAMPRGFLLFSIQEMPGLPEIHPW
jgi:hypothetical protein